MDYRKICKEAFSVIGRAYPCSDNETVLKNVLERAAGEKNDKKSDKTVKFVTEKQHSLRPFFAAAATLFVIISASIGISKISNAGISDDPAAVISEMTDTSPTVFRETESVTSALTAEETAEPIIGKTVSDAKMFIVTSGKIQYTSPIYYSGYDLMRNICFVINRADPSIGKNVKNIYDLYDGREYIFIRLEKEDKSGYYDITAPLPAYTEDDLTDFEKMLNINPLPKNIAVSDVTYGSGELIKNNRSYFLGDDLYDELMRVTMSYIETFPDGNYYDIDNENIIMNISSETGVKKISLIKFYDGETPAEYTAAASFNGFRISDGHSGSFIYLGNGLMRYKLPTDSSMSEGDLFINEFSCFPDDDTDMLWENDDLPYYNEDMQLIRSLLTDYWRYAMKLGGFDPEKYIADEKALEIAEILKEDVSDVESKGLKDIKFEIYSAFTDYVTNDDDTARIWIRNGSTAIYPDDASDDVFGSPYWQSGTKGYDFYFEIKKTDGERKVTKMFPLYADYGKMFEFSGGDPDDPFEREADADRFTEYLNGGLEIYPEGNVENSGRTSSSDMGFLLYLENVTPEGADLIYEPSGTDEDTDYYFYSDYTIEKFFPSQNNWYFIKYLTYPETKPAETETDENISEGYRISTTHRTTEHLYWYDLYGELSPGTYRLHKKIYSDGGSGIYEQDYLISFVISA